jgi:hypothetical protein
MTRNKDCRQPERVDRLHVARDQAMRGDSQINPYNGNLFRPPVNRLIAAAECCTVRDTFVTRLHTSSISGSNLDFFATFTLLYS